MIVLKKSTNRTKISYSIRHTQTAQRGSIMVSIQSSVTGQYWQIVVNGRIVEGFAKRGHGKATKAQVEAIADTYRGRV